MALYENEDGEAFDAPLSSAEAGIVCSILLLGVMAYYFIWLFFG